MPTTVYILYSPSKDRYYIGQTGDLNRRLVEHNSGQSKSTRAGIPWQLVYRCQFDNRRAAVHYESYLKRMKSRRFIEELIKSG
ncbi:MAG: GIY-YIG nuclease family protein [Fidelibacterota bacterium]